MPVPEHRDGGGMELLCVCGGRLIGDVGGGTAIMFTCEQQGEKETLRKKS